MANTHIKGIPINQTVDWLKGAGFNQNVALKLSYHQTSYHFISYNIQHVRITQHIQKLSYLNSPKSQPQLGPKNGRNFDMLIWKVICWTMVSNFMEEDLNPTGGLRRTTCGISYNAYWIILHWMDIKFRAPEWAFGATSEATPPLQLRGWLSNVTVTSSYI